MTALSSLMSKCEYHSCYVTNVFTLLLHDKVITAVTVNKMRTFRSTQAVEPNSGSSGGSQMRVQGNIHCTNVKRTE